MGAFSLSVRRATGLLRSLILFAHDQKGSATIEVALTTLFMAYAVINVADISIYSYIRMQVQNAAQMGAQSVYEACDSDDLPATSDCSDMSAAVLRGIQSTPLGAQITLQSGSPAEGWYCINSNNDLQYMSSYQNKPVDCSGAGMASLQPGDYIKVDTQYTYSPIFPSNVTVGSLLGTSVRASALVRLE